MMKEYWNRFLHWSGWKKVFPFPVWADVLMLAVFGAGLIWVFVNGFELWWPSYILYGLSAYSLVALCIKLPGAVRKEKNWIRKHPHVSGFLDNSELRFSLELYAEQFINFTYGIFKIASGVIVGSAWIGADGIYNFAQALIQLFQILRRKKTGNHSGSMEILSILRFPDPSDAPDPERHRVPDGQLAPGGRIRGDHDHCHRRLCLL